MSESPPIRITGEAVVEGLRSWAQDEIRNSPARAYDLGRFLFSVTTGTMAMFVALLRVTSTEPRTLFYCSAGLHFLAACIGLFMAIPRMWRLHGGTDLLTAHQRIIRAGQRRTGAWFLVWIVGFALGIASLFV